MKILLSLFLLLLLSSPSSRLLAQMPVYVSHWTSATDLSEGTAGAVSSFTLDSLCSQVKIQVTDPINSPLPPFNAYTLNPLDSMGNEVTDLSGNLRIYVRARSLDTVRMAVLLRSGGGTSSERTDRVELSIPGDTSSWTQLIFTFNASNLAGFDSLDFRDIWFYLDRGTNNFAGNEFYLDYISIGAAPDSSTYSTCSTASPAPPPPTSFYTVHWDAASDPLFTGSAAATLMQLIDPACSQLSVAVTDPVNAPLDDFGVLIMNPKDSAGLDITDLSGQMQFHVRARSLDSVRLGLLLRSGDGTAPFRTVLQEQWVPADTAHWTLLSYVIDTSNLGGFDSTDLRDLWLYLDRGTDNFAGNEFYLDFIALGSLPDTALNSTCLTDTTGNDTTQTLQYTLHWNQGADPVFSGSAAATLTQSVDTTCSQIGIVVTDPANTPLPSFSPIILDPKDYTGMDVTDLSGSARIHVRVRSRDSVRLGFLARSGDGTPPFRSNLKEVIVPGDTLNWTEISFRFDTLSLGGFDSTDLRDLWFFLDRGTDNFAGNEFFFDYVAIGERPDPADDSPCSLLPPFAFPYLLHWADSLDGIFTGTGAESLTQTVDTACSQLLVSVTDPIGNPLAAFRPLIINPQDGLGNDLTDLSGQMRFYTRVRSKNEVELSMVLRAGSGSTAERTAIVAQTVPGDLSQWTELTYTFTGSDYAGFDSTDLRDFWFYLDREDPNFNGNEIYFDYVSIGSKPEPSLNSDCIQTVSIGQELNLPGLTLYPNPSQGDQAVEIAFTSEGTNPYVLQVYDLMGRMVWQETLPTRSGSYLHTLQSHQWAPGLYTIQVQGNGLKGQVKWLIN